MQNVGFLMTRLIFYKNNVLPIDVSQLALCGSPSGVTLDSRILSYMVASMYVNLDLCFVPGSSRRPENNG